MKVFNLLYTYVIKQSTFNECDAREAQESNRANVTIEQLVYLITTNHYMKDMKVSFKCWAPFALALYGIRKWYDVIESNISKKILCADTVNKIWLFSTTNYQYTCYKQMVIRGTCIICVTHGVSPFTRVLPMKQHLIISLQICIDLNDSTRINGVLSHKNVCGFMWTLLHFMSNLTLFLQCYR